jgi:PKHD-type hydroxylase
MMLCIGDVFDQQEAAAIRSEVENLIFMDGRATAGWAARLVMDMSKLTPTTTSSRRSEHASLSGSHKTKIFQMAVRPKALTPLMISRYKPGNIDSVSSRGASASTPGLFVVDPTAHM